MLLDGDRIRNLMITKAGIKAKYGINLFQKKKFSTRPYQQFWLWTIYLFCHKSPPFVLSYTFVSLSK